MSCECNDRVATPPELNFTLKTNLHVWSRNEIQSQLRTDILLITTNYYESSACYYSSSARVIVSVGFFFRARLSLPRGHS
jgi:hypothetical protein